jgi:hypothetical protein
MGMFPTLNEFLVESETELKKTVFSNMIQYFNDLQCISLDYFPFATDNH